LYETYRSFEVDIQYCQHSQQQADKIQQHLLNHHDCETSTYLGFNFAEPYIPTALQSAQNAGVTKLVVVNQGAAYSEEVVLQKSLLVYHYRTLDNKNRLPPLWKQV